MSPSQDPGKKYEIFISYCSEDSRLLEPISKLLKTGREDLVFFDRSNLKAGKKWEAQLLKALDEVALVFVFWCAHAAESEYVKKEYSIAIAGGKDITPVLLDDTKLPNDLAAYQWIDFRNLFPKYHKAKLPGALPDSGNYVIRDRKVLDHYYALKRKTSDNETFLAKMSYNWPFLIALKASIPIGIVSGFIAGSNGVYGAAHSALIGTAVFLSSFLLIFISLFRYERRVIMDRQKTESRDVSTQMAMRDDARRFTGSEKLKRLKTSGDRYMAGAVLLARLEEIPVR